MKAAKQGDDMAYPFLGMAYENGWGVDVSVVESVRHYRVAASTLAHAAARVAALTDAYKEEVSSE